MSHFRAVDRDTPFMLPPTVQDWLAEGHLARFVVEVIEQLDLSALERVYAGRGSAAYHPGMLVGLLVYGYATGTFSSRKIERATYDSLAFRYLAANTHPDHDTLANFRRRFGGEFQAIFVQVLAIARESQLARFGRIALDGTKVHANASRHSALSYGHAERLEAQLEAEVKELLSLAEQADSGALPEGMSLPQELALRHQRLAVIAEAKARIEARAAERQAREQAAYEAKVAARQAKAQASGKPPRGKEPQPPPAGPRSADQVNLTDDESRIMPVAGGGFEQCYNAQAAVDTDSMLVVTTHVTQAPNDKEQVAPVLERLAALPEELGRPEVLLADSGYCSAGNVERCAEAAIEPLLATGREVHHPHWQERYAEPVPLAQGATAMEVMAHRLKTREGRQLYALRKQTVEPVFGIIKSVLGFRQFLLRGLEAVRQEWTLVCLAWNFKRLAVLRLQGG
jgi:transposase/IS5 family transposase